MLFGAGIVTSVNVGNFLKSIYFKDTSTKLMGISTPRCLEQSYAGIINVKDFGAQGNGEDDDTDALENAFKNYHAGKIYFPNGIYIVTRTLVIKNNRRFHSKDNNINVIMPKIIDLGASCIVWKGHDCGGPIFKLSCQSITLCNGKIIGSPKNAINDKHKCNICILITNEYGSAFNTRLENIVINGYARCAISIGDCIHKGSYGACLSNIYITANNSQTDWENSGPAGIEIWGCDNKFVNVVTQRNKCHILLHTSGNQFVNCHFISTTKNKFANSNRMPETAGVWYSLANRSSWYQNTFVGCYFDNVKYVIYNELSHNTLTQLTGCFYFNSGANIPPSLIDKRAYVVGGRESVVHIVNFSIQPGQHIMFLSGVEKFTNCSQYCSENYVRTNWNNPNISIPWLAEYKVKSGQCATIANKCTMRPNIKYCIGGILISDKKDIAFKIKIYSRGQNSYEANMIYDRINVVKFQATKNINKNFPVICIHPEIEMDIDGEVCSFLPICIYNSKRNIAWLSATIECLDNCCGLYLTHISQCMTLAELATCGVLIRDIPLLIINNNDVK